METLLTILWSFQNRLFFRNSWNLEFALKARHKCRVRTRSLSKQAVWHVIYLFLHHHVHTSLIGRESVSHIFSIAAIICSSGTKSLTVFRNLTILKTSTPWRNCAKGSVQFTIFLWGCTMSRRAPETGSQLAGEQLTQALSSTLTHIQNPMFDIHCSTLTPGYAYMHVTTLSPLHRNNTPTCHIMSDFSAIMEPLPFMAIPAIIAMPATTCHGYYSWHSHNAYTRNA